MTNQILTPWRDNVGRKAKATRPSEFAGKPIYRGLSAWNYHQKDPKTGKQRTIRLAPVDASPAEVLEAYAAKTKELKKESRRDSNRGSVTELIETFFESPTFMDLSRGTQGQYQKNSRQILKVFGSTKSGRPVMASTLKPQHVRRYMDLRGKTAKVSANRELAFMSRLFAWAYERGMVPINPCKGVRKFTEKSRDRYITDEEYFAVLAHADDRLRAIIEIAYCCAARVSDVLKIERSDIRKEGIFIAQGKTDKAQIKGWTPRLREAYEIASRVSIQHHRFILTNQRGGKIAYDTFRKWWTTAKEKAEEANPSMKLDFTFHDIKAKSISDWEGDKQKFSGHKTQSQVAVYDRKVPIVGAHE
ncbi:MAG: tyrosine-type recombinase/integrase [Oceanobacter sp.]